LLEVHFEYDRWISVFADRLLLCPCIECLCSYHRQRGYVFIVISLLVS